MTFLSASISFRIRSAPRFLRRTISEELAVGWQWSLPASVFFASFSPRGPFGRFLSKWTFEPL